MTLNPIIGQQNSVGTICCPRLYFDGSSTLALAWRQSLWLQTRCTLVARLGSIRLVGWSYGVMVSTLDFESSDPGQIPVGAEFEHLQLVAVNSTHPFIWNDYTSRLQCRCECSIRHGCIMKWVASTHDSEFNHRTAKPSGNYLLSTFVFCWQQYACISIKTKCVVTNSLHTCWKTWERSTSRMVLWCNG